MAEVIEYNPADLVVRAQAGLPLATLQAVLAESGQRLALDPPEAGGHAGRASSRRTRAGRADTGTGPCAIC